MLGFSYNGKHTDEMHIGYIPDAGERGDLVSDYSIVSADRSWAPGADYYTTRTKVREFKLKCFYEMITRREREEILRWIDRRTSGYLIFDDRPYARYTVRPNKAPDIKDYTQFVGTERVFSGTMTIYFAAYYPFADLIETTSDNASPEALADLDLLPSSMMPTIIQPIRSNVLIYNPGTETGNSIIRFSGSAGSEPITIINNENGDTCTITAGYSTTTRIEYEFDSKLGRAAIHNFITGQYSINSRYHDDGFIHFEPNRIIRKNIQVRTTSGSSVVQGYGSFSNEMVGAYICIDDEWKKIINVTNNSSLTIESSVSTTTSVRTNVVTMNHLTIIKDTANIEYMYIICNSEVR